MERLTKQEREQLKKIIKATGYVPPALYLESLPQDKGKGRKPETVIIKIRDQQKVEKFFEFHPVRREFGVLAKPLEYPIQNVISIGKRTGGFQPWITEVIDDRDPIFPYYHGDDTKVVLSPTLILVRNKKYSMDKIDPYNVELAGFLFINNPRLRKNFLEAVSGSVVGNLAVVESLMKSTGEEYTRKNHLFNWLAYLQHPDSKGKVVVQCFNMHIEYLELYKKFLNKLA